MACVTAIKEHWRRVNSREVASRLLTEALLASLAPLVVGLVRLLWFNAELFAYLALPASLRHSLHCGRRDLRSPGGMA